MDDFASPELDRRRRRWRFQLPEFAVPWIWSIGVCAPDIVGFFCSFFGFVVDIGLFGDDLGRYVS